MFYHDITTKRKTEEEIKKAEETWLEKIEREYSESRAEKGQNAESDAWAGGNMNRRDILGSDDSDLEGDETAEDEDIEADVDNGVSLDLPEEEEDDD